MPAIVTVVHQQHQEYQQNPKQDASNSWVTNSPTDKIGEKFVQQRKPCDISKDKNTTG
jgi:hypothetical protein